MLNPVRWYRNLRADRRALKNMTPAQRAIVRAYRVPPRLFTSHGTYANAESARRDLSGRLIQTRYLCPAPRSDGRCLEPLPCIEHGVRDHATGTLLYGNAYLETPEGAGYPMLAHYTMHADGTVTDNTGGRQ